VIFDELPDDRSRSLGVFLDDFTAHLRSANVTFEVVRPPWRIRGVPSQWRHLVTSSILRQFAYPLWARRRFSPGAINFVASGGLAQLLWLHPVQCRTVLFCHGGTFVLAANAPKELGYRLDFGGWLRARYLAMVRNPAFRRADLILVPSESARSVLVRTIGISPSRVVAIHHRIDSTTFRPGDKLAARAQLGWPEKASIVLAIVTTERRKNLDTLLDSFALLAAQEPNARLALIGPLSKAQRSRCERIAGQERLMLLSNLSTDKMVSCYRAASCLAHLSLYEGFGYPLVEAMACGCPIVCLARGSVPEVVRDCAEYAPSLHPAAIAGVFSSLLSNRTRQEELRERGLVRARDFFGERPYIETIRRFFEERG